jgi:hypothetical protein
MQSRAVHRSPDSLVIRWVRKLYVNQRAAAKVNSQRDSMPEQHGDHTRHTEHQGKGEKVPLFAEKIYVWITKKFHAALNPSIFG